MNTVDARGLACPEPVLLTKRAADAGTGVFAVLVDDEVPLENIKRFCDGYNCSLAVEPLEGYWQLTVSPPAGGAPAATGLNVAGPDLAAVAAGGLQPVTMIIARNRLGDNEELGELLVEGLINTLPEAVNPPATLIFMNGGVRLTAEGSHVLPALRALEALGVEIKSCGTCLDYYQLKDKLRVGIITNMYETAEKITSGGKVVTI